MGGVKILALALLACGVLGLMYGGFSYTKDVHSAKVGAIELSVADQQRINIPVWAGVGAIVIGGVLLLFKARRS